MSTVPPDASVIVPVYNGQDFIGPCLQSILAQDIDVPYEIIVVDDGSMDATVSIVRSFTDPRVHLISGDVNRGICCARNKGVAQARGRRIAFTDSDCIVDPRWLSELIKPFDLDDHIMIVGGRIVDARPRTYWEKVNNGMNYIRPASGYVAKIIGCNMAFQKSFLIANLFDEYLAADEWDLCICCERQDKKIFYTDKAIVTHYHRHSLKSSLVQQFRYGYSIAYLKIKHGQFPFFAYGALNLTAVGMCLAAGQWSHQFYYLAGLFFLLFAALIGYWNARGGTRAWGEWVVTYPGFAVVFAVFCFGNLFFPFLYVRDRFFR